MSDVVLGQWSLACDELRCLVRRCEFAKALLRRQIEEQLTLLVYPDLSVDDSLWSAFYQNQGIDPSDGSSLDNWLLKRGWSKHDLSLHLLRPVAMRRFAEQRYAPGLEEHFLSRKNDLDAVIYSLLRVRDSGLARELWIQLSEGEVTFAEVAESHSDGPEASTKGVIGPRSLGSIEPALATRLRAMRVGDLRPPEHLGEWHVLLRLESLTPARLDEATRTQLLQEQLEAWMGRRVDAILDGEIPDPLHFDTDP